MICLVLTAKTIEENLALYKRNRQFVDIVELRVDLLQEDGRKQAFHFPELVDLPVILTCRRVSDGGSYDGTEKCRFALLESCLEGNFAYIDIEEDVKRFPAEQKVHEKGVRIIRSYHDFTGVPADFYHKIAKMAQNGDIPKAAVMVHSVNDLITLFRAEKELTGMTKIIVGMGDYGVPSRILYRRTGSLLTYCSETAVAPGQITAHDMKKLYRGDMVDNNTRIYGVIGNPVLHSLSPRIQNLGFQGIKYNAVYIPFPVDSVRSFFTLAELLPIWGFSVTAPYKQAVLPYLGRITREVKQIGSCNTVSRVQNSWIGTNTDYYGFIEPLVKDIDEGKIRHALVIGAGGAARAAVWALRNHGCKVTILNRNMEKGRDLAEKTMSFYDSLEHAKRYEDVDLIVQATSVGMGEDREGDPIPDYQFNDRQTVYELIYHPRYTKLLRRAKEAGCRLFFGMDMLIRQGKLQFEVFTGYHYPKRLEQVLQREEY